MGPILIIVLFFGGLTGLIVWLIRYGRKKNHLKNEKFRDLALRLNLTYTERPHMFVKIPFLSGTWKNHQIEIYENVVGSGKNQAFFTNIRFVNSPYQFDFRIVKEHLFSKMGKKLGINDIEFDNVELDKIYIFKSKDEASFRTIMDYNIQQRLLELAPKFKGTIRNENGNLTFVQAGVVSKPQHFEALEETLMFMESLMSKSAVRT